MSSQTVVDVVISGTTATVVDPRVDGITTVAGAAPITNVSEIVRSTLIPSKVAMVRSCSHARWARPSAVRAISAAKITINKIVSKIIKI